MWPVPAAQEQGCRFYDTCLEQNTLVLCNPKVIGRGAITVPDSYIFDCHFAWPTQRQTKYQPHQTRILRMHWQGRLQCVPCQCNEYGLQGHSSRILCLALLQIRKHATVNSIRALSIEHGSSYPECYSTSKARSTVRSVPESQHPHGVEGALKES